MIKLELGPLLIVLLPSATLRRVESVEVEQEGHLILTTCGWSCQTWFALELGLLDQSDFLQVKCKCASF